MIARRCSALAAAVAVATAVAVAVPTAANAQAAHAQGQPQGRVLTAEGTVELSPDAGTVWRRAAVAEPVFTGNLIKTGRQSRAAVLLRDETQLRLNAYSVLEIKQVRIAGETVPAGQQGAGSGLTLTQGQAWVRTKNQGRGLAVSTPAATAAIRGTELALRVEGDVSELVVVEGVVELFNEQGSVTVTRGEGGRAEVGKAPVKFVVVDPEDAVQWVLHYPDFRTPGGGAPDTAAGRAVAEAADLLAYGDAGTAVSRLEAALAAEPGDRQALAMLALIRLTQNQVDTASDLVGRALSSGEEHFLASLVSAKVAQSRFDLPAALGHARAAQRLDPASIEAAATVAELLFGSGDNAAAGAIADELVARHPDSARALTLRGFIAFGTDRVEQAAADFQRALELDAAAADAHLGLGLYFMNRGQQDRGLDELLAATALEPRLALYQSYLGKGYAQVGRHVEALLALDSAKRLDPRDPTPHLYAGLVLRDLNRHADAVSELQRAIEKNDFRAVYRSRLLLDRDQATRNVSLAQLYSEVGFDAYGAELAVRSIERDFGNSSAHLFASGTLIALPDRTTAAASEFLHARLLLPVNQNAFNSFNDYTSLFEVPDADHAARAEVGEHSATAYDLTSYGGNDKVAYFATIGTDDFDDRLGVNTDQEELVWNVLAKVALSPNQSLLFDSQNLEAEIGDPGTVEIAADPDSPAVTAVRFIRSLDPDPNERIEAVYGRHTIGYHGSPRPGHHLMLTAHRNELDYDRVDPDALAVFGCGLTNFDEVAETGVQGLYHATVRERHQLFVGFDARERESDGFLRIDCSDASSADIADARGADDRFLTAYSRWQYRFRGDSSLTLGVRYDDLEVTDTFVDVNPTSRQQQWSPQLGLRWMLRPTLALRLAAFRNVAGHDSERLEPALLTGFAIHRAENDRTRRDEADLALDWTASERLFASASVFYREIEAPVYSILPVEDLLVRGTGAFDVRGTKLDLDVRLSRELTSYAELQYRDIATTAFEQRDAQGLLGLRYRNARGLSLGLTQLYLRQRFATDFGNLPLPETDAWLTDASARWELPRKRGRVGVAVRNAFDEDFEVVVEGLSVVQRLPVRETSLFFELLF